MRKSSLVILGLAVAAAALAAAAHAAGARQTAIPVGSTDVAAAQVGLRARGLYTATIDGLMGPLTMEGLRALQASAGLATTGALDADTRAVLGSHATAALQFALAWHGFPSSTFDGIFGPHVDRALRRFQAWARVPITGVPDAATAAALATPPPVSPVALVSPLPTAARGDGFGPRGDRFHAGIDLAAPGGAPVLAAGAGRVSYAGWIWGGWGNEVTIDHGNGVRSIYAHLSRIDVVLGQRVAAGEQLGAVGASGTATGPHLHFEVRLRGAAVDPGLALPSADGAVSSRFDG